MSSESEYESSFIDDSESSDSDIIVSIIYQNDRFIEIDVKRNKKCYYIVNIFNSIKKRNVAL